MYIYGTKLSTLGIYVQNWELDDVVEKNNQSHIYNIKMVNEYIKTNYIVVEFYCWFQSNNFCKAFDKNFTKLPFHQL